MKKRRHSLSTTTRNSPKSVLLDYQTDNVRVTHDVVWEKNLRIIYFDCPELKKKRFALGSDVAYEVGADAFNIYTQLRTDEIPVYYVNEDVTTHLLRKLNMRSRAKKLYLLDVAEVDKFVRGEQHNFWFLDSINNHCRSFIEKKSTQEEATRRRRKAQNSQQQFGCSHGS